MNRVLYYICRVMNWVLPIVLLWFGNEAIYKATDGSLEKRFQLPVELLSHNKFIFLRGQSFTDGCPFFCKSIVALKEQKINIEIKKRNILYRISNRT